MSRSFHSIRVNLVEKKEKSFSPAGTFLGELAARDLRIRLPGIVSRVRQTAFSLLHEWACS